MDACTGLLPELLEPVTRELTGDAVTEEMGKEDGV